jgi:hypothetical protein
MSVGALSDTGCIALQPFATGGNWSYLDFLAVTGDLPYSWYKTTTKGQLFESLEVIKFFLQDYTVWHHSRSMF